MTSDSTGADSWLSCDTPGATVTPPAGQGFGGAVTCPPLTIELLCEPHACPGLPCAGNPDSCFGGVCICGDAFGTGCEAGAPLPPRTPPPPLRSPPSLPPAAPGRTAGVRILFVLTVAGDVSDFDSDAVKAALASMLGVDASAIAFVVTSASVRVDVTITVLDASRASAVVDTVEAASTATLTSNLGVTVEAVSAVTTEAFEYGPPGTPPPSPAALDLPIMLLLAGVGGVVVVLLAVVACCCYCSTRRTKTNKRVYARGQTRGQTVGVGGVRGPAFVRGQMQA